MKLIAHRGLLNGPDKSLENKPDQIVKAISKGFDCEIDLWVVNTELWLGHDEPQYHIEEIFLKNKKCNLWIHAKNLEAFKWLVSAHTHYQYFWHQNDDFVLTSNKFIWTFPGKELTSLSIQVLPEWNDPDFTSLPNNCYAICSDYVEKIKQIRIAPIV